MSFLQGISTRDRKLHQRHKSFEDYNSRTKPSFVTISIRLESPSQNEQIHHSSKSESQKSKQECSITIYEIENLELRESTVSLHEFSTGKGKIIVINSNNATKHIEEDNLRFIAPKDTQ